MLLAVGLSLLKKSSAHTLAVWHCPSNLEGRLAYITPFRSTMKKGAWNAFFLPIGHSITPIIVTEKEGALPAAAPACILLDWVLGEGASPSRQRTWALKAGPIPFPFRLVCSVSPHPLAVSLKHASFCQLWNVPIVSWFSFATFVVQILMYSLFLDYFEFGNYKNSALRPLNQ